MQPAILASALIFILASSWNSALAQQDPSREAAPVGHRQPKVDQCRKNSSSCLSPVKD